jgi:hypothetical protein
MTHHDHHHCQNCGANFEKKDQLEAHLHDCHRQQSLSGSTRNSGATPEVRPPRKGREFTRSYKE